MVDTTTDKVSSSNSHDIDIIIATHQQVSTNSTAASASTNTTNKRKLDTNTFNTNTNDTANKNPLLDDDGPPSSSNNKRRKKYKKKKNKGKQQHNNNSKSKKQQQHAKYVKKQQNWIESCSESIHRIPANCVAPLTCIITRVEIEEEPLLPKGKIDESIADTNTSSSDGGKEDKSTYDIKPSSIEAEVEAEKQQQANIARPTHAFLSQYSKNREPWKISSTMQVDNEKKKIFIPVKRHSSTVGPTNWTKRRKQQQQSGSSKNAYVHLPNGNSGDGILNPYPTSIVPDKFWAQRKRLFSKYDEGVQIHNVDNNNDGEMWYSVTPESIANHVADKMINMMVRQGCHQSTSSSSSKGNSITILDVFCGCGGNSIAFARLNAEKKEGRYLPRVKVIAVDNNLSRLKMAANNAAIYKIDKDNIVFIHADAVEVLNCYNKGILVDTKSSRQYESHQYAGYKLGGLELLPTNLDGIFLSPPWGGTEYSKQEAGKSGFDIITSIVVESSCCLKDDKEDYKSTTSVVKTNGGELLSLSAKAVLNDESTTQEGVIAYFLPRNTDGIILGQCAISSGIKGTFEMEQNVVNGKVKTVTAYFGREVDDKQGD